MRADVEVTCFAYEGVDAVREALLEAQKVSGLFVATLLKRSTAVTKTCLTVALTQVGTEDAPVKIKLVAPPLYVMTTTTLEKEIGVDLLNKAIACATDEIGKRKGALAVKVHAAHCFTASATELEDQNERSCGIGTHATHADDDARLCAGPAQNNQRPRGPHACEHDQRYG